LRRAATIALAVILFWLLAAGTAIPFAPLRSAAVKEATIYLVLLLVLAAPSAPRQMLRSASVMARWSAVAVWAFAIHVQVRNADAKPYPFAQWAMYGDRGGFRWFAYYAYVGVRSDGTSVRLSPTSMLPSLRENRLTTLLDNLAKAAQAADTTAEHARAVALYNEVLRTLGRLYNAERPDSPVRRILVYRVSGDLHRRPLRWQRGQSQVWDVEIR
jgi:hypothetical protein